METLTRVSPPDSVLGRVSLPRCFSGTTQEVGPSQGAAGDKAGRCSGRGTGDQGFKPPPLFQNWPLVRSRMGGQQTRQRGWRLHACVQR